MSLTGTVTKAEINGPIPRSEFTVRFPPGAQVNETGSSVGMYVVRKDGTLRRIERSELGEGKTFDELAATPSRVEIQQRQRFQRSALFGAIIALGALGVALLCWRRRATA
jgi:hypothetical protein